MFEISTKDEFEGEGAEGMHAVTYYLFLQVIKILQILLNLFTYC